MNHHTPWERIQFVLKHSNVMSLNRLAFELGLKRSANLYQIKKGNNDISKKLAEAIIGKYPGFSEGWLLTGKGAPFAQENISKEFYHISYYATANHLLDKVFIIPAALSYGAQYAAILKSKSFEPTIPMGSLILLTKSPRIIYGNKYYIELKNGESLYRIIQKSGYPGFIRLLAENPDYEEIEIAEKEIDALFPLAGFITYF